MAKTNKLGFVQTAPMVPVMPIAAQYQPLSRYLHLKLGKEGYVNAPIRGCIDEQYEGQSMKGILPPAVEQAVRTVKEYEPSYSGSGNSWIGLTVVPASDGRSCKLMIGSVLFCRVVVIDDAPINDPVDKDPAESKGQV